MDPGNRRAVLAAFFANLGLAIATHIYLEPDVFRADREPTNPNEEPTTSVEQ